MRNARRGVTLPELMIAIAVVAILLGVGVPSLREFILTQRVKAVNAQLVTDMQFARSEAVARNQWVRVAFEANDAMSCYSIYTSDINATRCNCLSGVGAACSGTMREIRTVQVPATDQVRLNVILDAQNDDTAFAFDHVTGRIVGIPIDLAGAVVRSFKITTSADSARALRTEIIQVGRVQVCNAGTTSLGPPACP